MLENQQNKTKTIITSTSEKDQAIHNRHLKIGPCASDASRYFLAESIEAWNQKWFPHTNRNSTWNCSFLCHLEDHAHMSISRPQLSFRYRQISNTFSIIEAQDERFCSSCTRQCDGKVSSEVESIRMMTPFREEEEDESVFVAFESNRTRRPRSAVGISSDEPHASHEYATFSLDGDMELRNWHSSHVNCHVHWCRNINFEAFVWLLHPIVATIYVTSRWHLHVLVIVLIILDQRSWYRWHHNGRHRWHDYRSLDSFRGVAHPVDIEIKNNNIIIVLILVLAQTAIEHIITSSRKFQQRTCCGENVGKIILG